MRDLQPSTEISRVAARPPPRSRDQRGEQEVERRAAAHELHGLEHLADGPARDHQGQRLVAVHRRGRRDTGSSRAAATTQLAVMLAR